MDLEVKENDYKAALNERKDIRDKLFELRVKLSTELLSEEEKLKIEEEIKEVVKKMRANSYTRNAYEILNNVEQKRKR